MDFPIYSTTIYFTAKVADEKFSGQTVIQSNVKEQYEEAMADFFATVAAKLDGEGEPLFVTFEPRVVSGFSGGASAGSGKGPLPQAPAEVGKCPIHLEPLSEKTNRTTQQKFYSCSKRNGDGSYCNWTPPK